VALKHATNSKHGEQVRSLQVVRQLTELQPHLTRREFNNGQPICKQGEEGRTMYFIEEGTVRFYRQDGEEKQWFVRNLESGDFFGEVALLTDGTRSLTAQARGRVVVQELSSEGFDVLLKVAPETAKAIMAEMAYRLKSSAALIGDVREQIQQDRTWSEKIVQRTVQRIGTFWFTVLNLVVMVPWILYNGFAPHPPERQFAWLGLLATCEALVVAILVLAKQNRDEKDNDIRTESILNTLKRLEEKLFAEEKQIEAREEKIEGTEKQILDNLARKK